VDFLGWVHFPRHRVLKKTTDRRMFKRIYSHPTNETPQSYLGLISHSKTEPRFVMYGQTDKDKILSISLRLPEYIISQVKVQANKLDVPYQSLMKQYIAKGALLNKKQSA
jgi:hypothetical protein